MSGEIDISPSYDMATISIDKLDPKFLKQFSDMQATIDKLTRMVDQLYYPYRKTDE